jgi:ADP-ribose pyrophosphatase YjhB (NUDIX family)
VYPKVRATAVLIEQDRILLVQQRVDAVRGWSLPGGALEAGETLADCVAREVKEETGLEVAVGRLLYVCDRIDGNQHVVHVTFAVHQVGGRLQVGAEPEAGANPIYDVRMVPVASLGDYGFSQRFCERVVAGFPDGGTYQGAVSNIGL